MAATSQTFSPSGNPDVDGLTGGQRWSTGNLFYSFPTSASAYSYDGEPDQCFQAVTLELKPALRKALSEFSQVANLTFTETTSNSADLRIAMTDLTHDSTPASARGFEPRDAPQENGDLWLDTAPVLGSDREAHAIISSSCTRLAIR